MIFCCNENSASAPIGVEDRLSGNGGSVGTSSGSLERIAGDCGEWWESAEERRGENREILRCPSNQSTYMTSIRSNILLE
jgi:hypothetical protein